jgi:hypothetical protein
MQWSPEVRDVVRLRAYRGLRVCSHGCSNDGWLSDQVRVRNIRARLTQRGSRLISRHGFPDAARVIQRRRQAVEGQARGEGAVVGRAEGVGVGWDGLGEAVGEGWPVGWALGLASAEADVEGELSGGRLEAKGVVFGGRLLDGEANGAAMTASGLGTALSAR